MSQQARVSTTLLRNVPLFAALDVQQLGVIARTMVRAMTPSCCTSNAANSGTLRSSVVDTLACCDIADFLPVFNCRATLRRLRWPILNRGRPRRKFIAAGADKLVAGR